MYQIWKFPLGDNKICKIEIPVAAVILCVQEQNNEGFLWARVNPKNIIEQRTFTTVLTGNPFEADGLERYIGTYQIDRGLYVMHVFETFKNDPD